jgi:hypothetical protein
MQPQIIGLGAASFLLTLSSVSSAAVIYDAISDFSTSNNSDTTRWSYRYSTTSTRDGVYELLPTYGSATGSFSPSQPGAWYQTIHDFPHLGVNQAGSDVTYTGGLPFTWKKDTMLIHPSNDGLVVLSWLSPATTLIDLDWSIVDIDANGGNGVAWFVEVNGPSNTLASGTIVNGGSLLPQAMDNVQMQAGDRVNFIVWANGNNGWDSTNLFATVTTVPEPLTVFPLAGALALLRRRYGRVKRS